MDNLLLCSVCTADINDLESICTSCGTFSGYPNVRLAERTEEIEALNEKYSRALIDAASRGAISEVQAFEDAVRKSDVVVAMSVPVLRALLVDRNALYSNYDLAVRGQVRRIAKADDDQHRRAADSRLWGLAATNIRYGALTLNGEGLKSYGACFVTLAPKYFEHRASVLETNSFKFVEPLTFADALPTGYRSNWFHRYKVAVAKCASYITASTKPSDFSEILLTAGSDRADDDFIEVHIYGPFSANAIQAVHMSNQPLSREDKLFLKIAKSHAIASGVKWIDAH